VLLLGLAFIIDLITVIKRNFSKSTAYHSATVEILHPYAEAEDSLLYLGSDSSLSYSSS
jgi:hypothetical protein